jgi:hypothetical protein
MDGIPTVVVAVTVTPVVDETVMDVVDGEVTRQDQALEMREGPQVATSLGAGGLVARFSFTAGLLVAVT